MSKKEEERYVCITEYDAAFVGTAGEITQWCHEEQIDISECQYYELGEEVTLKIGFVK